MSEWKIINIGQLGSFRNGLNFSQDDYGSGFSIINVKQLYGGRFVQINNLMEVKKSTVRNLDSLALKYGDILFARSSVKASGAGQVAMVNVHPINCVFSGFIIRFRIEALDQAYPLFINYLLRSPEYREILTRIGSGTTITNLTQETLSGLEICLPPLTEQKAIAHILGSLDDKIELNRRMNETLEAMARAIFKDWFVDFGPTRAKIEGRAPYLPEPIWSLFPDAIDPQSGLPVGWEKKPLPEVIDFKEGPGIRNWQYTNSEEGTRFINIRCIQDNDLNLKTANRITDDEANGKYSHFHLREWDIVVSTSGTLGRSAIVRKEHLPLVLNTSVIRFRPIDQKITKSFLFLYLNSPYFLEELMAMASGSVQKNFGPMHLKKMRVLTPPFDLVCQFEKRAGSLLNKVICNRSESDSLAELRDRLLPKLMSGEIRVKDAEKIVEEVL
ncbi:hypothetical protein BRW62_05365 [Parathermosynechococcus lividus PCC 6715]|uniref:Type I restriction modification DNA specificity domain-containing protein n=1 Tax=Parathermosynechococcus lividus PCC 6715 TaxID=1917166 RepID=A0A2D2Q1C2_PARLV|nr:restriction endonuclease subunit S [Thermostichus lividus]ATS18276.1 hypothetical protein BRW62_05365 [Thermostichus lividus PCC 6715]